MNRRACALLLAALFGFALLFSFSCLIVHGIDHDETTSSCPFCATLVQKIKDLASAIKIALLSVLLFKRISLWLASRQGHDFVFPITPVQLKIKLLN